MPDAALIRPSMRIGNSLIYGLMSTKMGLTLSCHKVRNAVFVGAPPQVMGYPPHFAQWLRNFHFLTAVGTSLSGIRKSGAGAERLPSRNEMR